MEITLSYSKVSCPGGMLSDGQKYIEMMPDRGGTIKKVSMDRDTGSANRPVEPVGPELSVFLVIDVKKGRDAKNISSGEAAGDSLEFDG